MGTAFLMGQGGGAASGGGGLIESVQYGKINITSGASSATVAINPVDLNKAVLFFLGGRPTYAGGYPLLELQNTNTVKAERYASSLGTSFASFMVVEFAGIKSIQRGVFQVNMSGTASLTVNPVDMGKTILVSSGVRFSSNNATILDLPALALGAANRITAYRQSSNGMAYAGYTLAEFN